MAFAMLASTSLRALVAALALVTVSRPGAAFAPPSLVGVASGAGSGPVRPPALQARLPARNPFAALKRLRTTAVRCKAGGGRDDSNEEEVGRGELRNVSAGAQKRSSPEPRFPWEQLDIDSEKGDVMMIKNDIGESQFITSRKGPTQPPCRAPQTRY